jgi:hypothetical protein
MKTMTTSSFAGRFRRGAPQADLLLFPLFRVDIFGRFRAFALILLQIRIHPPPLQRSTSTFAVGVHWGAPLR